MKHESFILLTKLACYLIVGVFTPWSSALAQWATEGIWPPKIIFVGVILPASMIGGASSVLAFLSSSYSNYNKDRKTSGDTQIITKS